LFGRGGKSSIRSIPTSGKGGKNNYSPVSDKKRALKRGSQFNTSKGLFPESTSMRKRPSSLLAAEEEEATYKGKGRL